MTSSFTLRKEYDDLVGGTVGVAPHGAHIDVHGALESRDGTITVDDRELIDALRSFTGAKGPVLEETVTDAKPNFTREDVEDLPVEGLSARAQVAAPPAGATQSGDEDEGNGTLTEPAASAVPAPDQRDASAGVAAEHGDENASPYEGLTVDELKEELENRGLPKTGNKGELIAALEADDKEKAGA